MRNFLSFSAPFLTVLMCFSFFISGATNLYWIGGTGNWNDGSHWATSSGGAQSGLVPTQSDNVFFDANSFTAAGQIVTINVNSNCNNMDWSGVTNNPTMSISSLSDMNFYGSMILNANMNVTGSTQKSLYFRSTTTANINTFGITTNHFFMFVGGGTYTIQSNINIPLASIYLDSGTLNTNGFTLNVQQFGTSGGAVTRILNLGSSTVNVSGTSFDTFGGSNYTVNAGTSTINLTGISTNMTCLSTQIFHNVNFTNSSGTNSLSGGLGFARVTFAGVGTVNSTTANFEKLSFLKDGTISGGANNFDTLAFAAGNIYTMAANATQTVGKFEIDGTCANRSLLRSSSYGTQTNFTSSSPVVWDNLYMYDIACSGTTFTANNCFDVSNNQGIAFNAPASKNLYWIGGTGMWNDPTHWSLTSGGVSANCLPTQADNVFFDGNSFTSGGQSVTLTGTLAVECKNMDWTGVTNSPVLTGTSSYNLQIYGSLIFSPNMNLTYAGKTYFRSTSSGNTITMSGQSFTTEVHFDGANADWTLMDAFTATGANGNLFLDNGYLVTNDKTVNINKFSTSGANSRGLYLMNSTINIAAAAQTSWSVSGTNFTNDPGMSTINLLGGGTNVFTGGAADYYNLNFQSATGIGSLSTGANFHNVTFNCTASIANSTMTFNKVVFNKDAAVSNPLTFDTLQLSGGYNYDFTNGYVYNINKLIVPGACSGVPTIRSLNSGFQATINATSPIVVNYVALKDINRTGSTFTANNSQDLGNNTGILINPPVGQNLYWVGGSGNWDDAAHWSLSAGGAGGACVPTAADNVFFTTGSFTAGSKTLTMNVAAFCNNMSWTGAQFTPVVTGTAQLNVYGSLTFITGMNISGYTGTVLFYSSGASTITMAGKSFNNDIGFVGTGSYTLQDALNFQYTIYLSKGTLNTNNKPVTCKSFNSNYSNTRTVNLGSSIVTLTGIGPQITAYVGNAFQNIFPSWYITNSSSMTVNAGTSTIRLTSAGSTSFAGANEMYYNVEFQDPNGLGIISENTLPSSFHNITFYGPGFIDGNVTANKVDFKKNGDLNRNNTMDTLLFTPGYTYKFGAYPVSSIQTVVKHFSAMGTSSSPITFNCASTPFATLNMNGCNVCTDYLILQNIHATGTATFYAANSTDGGNNTGWNFAACPSANSNVGPISGPSAVCAGTTGNMFSVPVLTGASGYTWSVPAGYSIASGQGTATVNIQSGSSAGTITVTATACGTTTSATYTVSVNANPTITSITTSNATCSNSDGSLTAVVTGGATPYIYQWSSGATTATADSVAAGQYLLQVYDANGCKASSVASVTASDGPQITVTSTSSVTCAGGADGTISISVAGGYPPYDIDWSDGSSSTSLTGLNAGPYDVTVTDTNNCVATTTVLIPEASPITISSSSNPSACAGATGDATVIAAGGDGTYTYLWDAAAASQTSATATSLAAGVYSVTVTDGSSCSVSASVIVSNTASTLAASIGNIIAGDCSANSPGSLTVFATGGVSPYTYTWSNGSTNPINTPLQPGAYYVTVSDASLCTAVATATVPSANANMTQSLCMVTVDTATFTNLVVWEKTITTGIQSFKIYRESSIQNVYTLIATRPYDSLSQYTDPVANPAVHSWRYKISAVDSCNNETPYSLSHKTIHLTQNLGVGGEINLSWDYYDGFTYSTYYIWRHDPSTNWVLLDSLSANYTTYTDFTPPSSSSRYMIEVNVPAGGCNSTYRLTPGTPEVSAIVNTSRSNIKNNIAAPVTTGIASENTAVFHVYPNPADDVVTLQFANTGKNALVEIMDVTGRVVYSVTVNDNKKIIPVSSFSDGVYFISVSQEKTRTVKKLVIKK